MVTDEHPYLGHRCKLALFPKEQSLHDLRAGPLIGIFVGSRPFKSLSPNHLTSLNNLSLMAITAVLTTSTKFHYQYKKHSWSGNTLLYFRLSFIMVSVTFLHP